MRDTNLSGSGAVFYYEKWDVYKAAERLREIAQELSALHPRGAAPDLDQLPRASSSVILNLCEGARELHSGKKIERYSISCSSASECNGALLILQKILDPSAGTLIDEGRGLTVRIAAMMTNLIRNTERRQREEDERKREEKKNRPAQQDPELPPDPGPPL